MIKVSSVREIAEADGWRGVRRARVACYTAMMIIIMMATLHAPATASVCQPVVLRLCVLCVCICVSFSRCLCLLLLLCYIFLSAHLLRIINENAHINISYFNTKTTHKMTTSRASRGSSILLVAAPISAPPIYFNAHHASRILLFSSEYFRPLNWHTRIRHRIHFPLLPFFASSFVFFIALCVFAQVL